MKNTLTRTLALMMALLLALSVCAFADETEAKPGEIVETVTPADDLIDDVDETPAEAEGELEEEPVEVEEELVVEDAPEIVTDEAMMDYVPLFYIGGKEVPWDGSEKVIDVSGKFAQAYPEANPIESGDVTLTIDAKNQYTLTLQDAEIEAGQGGIMYYGGDGTLTIQLIGSNSIISQGQVGIYALNALEIKGEANSSLTINARYGGILVFNDGEPNKETKLTVSGGNVTVKTTGDEDSDDCYGIRCTELTVTGGELTATGGAVGEDGLSLGVALGKLKEEPTEQNKDTKIYFLNGKLNADGMVIRSGANAASSVEMDADTYLKLLAKQKAILHNDEGGYEAREADAEPTSLKYFHAEPKKEAASVVISDSTPAATPTTAVPAPEADGLIVASMKTAGKTGFKFTWTPIAGAEGYDVFLCNCGEKDYDVVATAAGSARSITVPNLKKYTAYKGYVRAWQMVNGQKTYITAASPMIHAITGGNTNKYTNPKKITVKKAKFTLKPGKTAKIRASVKKLENSKNLLDHEAKVRYYSSNPAVATVNAKGKITAVAAGRCKIYVIAINGLRKAVTVKVK